MKRWIIKNKFFLISFIISLLFTPVVFKDYRIECSSDYECFIYCILSILISGVFGILLDAFFYKECDK